MFAGVILKEVRGFIFIDINTQVTDLAISDESSEPHESYLAVLQRLNHVLCVNKSSPTSIYDHNPSK